MLGTGQRPTVRYKSQYRTAESDPITLPAPWGPGVSVEQRPAGRACSWLRISPGSPASSLQPVSALPDL